VGRDVVEVRVRLSGGYQAEHFEVDGSLRDVCVLGTDVAVWERLIAAVAGIPGEYRFSIDREAAVLADFSVRRFFAAEEREMSPQLDLRIGALWFGCYFFEPGEIEFSFGPEDLGGGVHFEALGRFMLWLAEVSGRRVILTHEHSSSHEDSLPLVETVT
jgi:hypothetical protein